jgi:predicted acetyltransferase
MTESTLPLRGGDGHAPSSYGRHIGGSMGILTLRLPQLDDEEAVRGAHAQLAQEDFAFALGLQADMSWGQYLEWLEQKRLGTALDDGDVAMTLLLAEVDGNVVGRTSIRHRLNDHYRYGFGHVGYAVLPEFRGRGYAAQILDSSLVLASELGIDSALLVCHEQNLASVTVIEHRGGRFESSRVLDGVTVRRYWIDT